VLRGVDLRAEPGTLTAILGASGTGKTTLLRVIAGFESADEGVVSLAGTVVEEAGRRHVPPERRRIGYVPQEGALFPHLTVRANAAFALPRRLRRGSRPDGVLSLLGLDGLGGRYPHELSGGQQQRVAVARALASEPGLVLLDEPFSSLDAALRAAVRADVLGVLRASGTTAVLVTHDQDEALSAADHVAVMREGVIVQADSPREVYTHPADPWTASFVGTANLLSGVVADGAARTVLGSHPLHAGNGPAAGPATVLIRPEQLVLGPPDGGAPAARVMESRYHGHDALITMRLEPAVNGQRPAAAETAPAPDAPPELLHARIICGGPPAAAGEKVGVRVSGEVVAWPASAA